MPPAADPIEEAWGLLDDGRPEEALRAAESRLREDPGDGGALLVAGSALLEMGEHARARARLSKALDADPGDPAVRLTMAALHYETCEFAAGLDHVDHVLRQDPGDGYAHYLRGLLCDMLGRSGEADACFRRAAELDPDRCPLPAAIGAREFDAAVAEAVAALPPDFRSRIEGLPILVEDVPSLELLKTLDRPAPDLLGLFVGTPLTLKSHMDLPGTDAVYLFKRNLERAAADREELVEEIGVTLLHEIGHYLGMEEDDLDEAGFA
ncbi:MAG TPA: metallopeptidase family protein [Candidatus Polarisedimenticolia bacterium]|nr:metallopeptidase family protein [Candidatus Polarisedimenticolia bacterium]